MFSGLLLAAMAAGLPTPEIKVHKVGAVYQLRLGNAKPFRTTREKVTAASTFRANSVVVGTWREGTSTRYLLSPSGDAVAVDKVAEERLLLKAGAFDPLKAVAPISDNIPTPATNEVRLIQFRTQPLPEYLETLAGLGATVYDTIAPNAAIVRVPADALESVRALPFVRWAGNYEASYRLDPTLVAQLEQGTLPTKRYNIWCHQRGLAMQTAVADHIRMLGGSVEQLTAPGFILSATLTPVQLIQILGLNEVSYVDAWSEPQQDMNIVRSSGGADFIETTLGFTGQGVRAEVMDGGLRTDHVAWTNPPLIHAPTMVNDSHGTNTFGINFGNGTGNSAGRGLMPSAQGVMARYNAMSGGNRYAHTAELLLSPYFCVYQSNSWGDTQTTAYTTISAEMDDILFLNDITILNSQSNTGNQNSRPQAWAKNVVAIGGVQHKGTAVTTDDTWGPGGASIGPAADGRYKPDLCHFYDQITCPTSTSTTAYTTSFGGTSAATPITAGHFGLFFQMWHNGIFGNPAPATTVFDNRPKATLAKAIMMNTAFQYPLGPQQADITRFVQGFGKVDLTNLYGIRNNWFWINETDVLNNLQTATYKVLVAAGTPALRFTMAYTDPAGTPGASVARKNNLSLRVTGPGGTIWRGNNGMTTSNWTVPGGSEDNINTVENVFIQNPAAGVYTVEVIGSDINTDARPETPGVNADFALVGSGMVNGNLAPSSFTVLDNGLVSGTLANLALSDNQKVLMTRGQSGSRFFRSTLELTHTSPSATVSKMTFLIERMNAVTGVTERYEIWNPTTTSWVQIGTGTVPQADGVVSLSIPSPQQYVGAGNEIKIRCTYERQDEQGSRTANVQVDYARLQVEP